MEDDVEIIMDYIANSPDLRRRIREKMLSKNVFVVRQMNDTSEDDLPKCAFTMYSDSRRWAEWFLFGFSVVALLSFGWVDFYMLGDIKSRVMPYSVLINHDKDRNNTQLQDLKNIKVQNAENIMRFILWLYAFIMIVRIVLQAMIMKEDKEDGREEHHSALPLLVMWWSSHLIVGWLVLFSSWETAIFSTATKYSGDILSDKMNSYALGDADLKLAIDRFQANYECCGSVNYTFWYRVDLYQFPDLEELEYDDPMREYLVGMFRVHYNLRDIVDPGVDDLQNFIDAHRGVHAKNVNSTKGVDSALLRDHNKRIFPIGSLPFTCCRPPSPATPICPFYNHRNLDESWKDVDDFLGPIYTDPCNKVVQDKLTNIAYIVEQTNFFRFLWECAFFVFVHIILHSFQSDWNQDQNPTITYWPGCIISSAWITLGCVFYFYIFKFFTLSGAGTKVTNFFFDE